jgi:hypothetical protein
MTGKGSSLNNRFYMLLRAFLAVRVAGAQDRLMWIGYSGSDPKGACGN